MKALKRIEHQGAHSSYVTAGPEFHALTPRDRRLAMELVLGILRRRGTLDRILSEYCREPLNSLEPDLLLLLRMGAYQLLFLDRVPPYAAISGSVDLCREAVGFRPRGLLNAILRRVQRDTDAWRLKLRQFPEQESEQAAWLSVPQWLWHRWIDRFGLSAARKWAETCNLPPRVDFRVPFATPENRQKLLDLEGNGSIRQSSHAPDAFSVQEHRTQDIPAEIWCRVHAQSLSSQLVARLLPMQAGDVVLDLCAAPGGKSIILAERTGLQGTVVAMDRYHHRFRVFADLLNRFQIRNILCVVGDAAGPLPFAGRWRRILLDAPCSGLGTLRRNPEIRWRAQPGDLQRMQGLQLALLRSAAANLLPGGMVLYSTCSTEPEENEEVIQAFLSERSDLALEKLPDSGDAGQFIDERGFFRTCPGHPEEDGFFAALLVRHACSSSLHGP